MIIRPRCALVLAAALITFAAGGTLANHAENTSPVENNLRTLFESYADAGQFSGVALVAQEGEFTFVYAAGDADRTTGVSNTVETRIRIASVSKQFTAACVLSLVDDGLIDLDDAVGEHVEGLNSEIGETVTIRHLLAHRSGLKRELFEEDTDFAIPHTSDEILASINRGELAFEPGTSEAYSNTGYVLLGRLIAEVTGGSFEDAMRGRVFGPAGMSNTGLVTSGITVPNLASGHTVLLGEASPPPPTAPENTHGAAGVYTTAGDLLLYDQALRDGKVVSPESQRLSRTSQGGKWGLGWKLMAVGEDDEGNTINAVLHNGDLGGVSAHLFRYPEDGFVIALLSNQSVLPRNAMFKQIVGVVNGGEPGPVYPIGIDAVIRAVLDEGTESGIEARANLPRGGEPKPQAMHFVIAANTLGERGRDDDARKVLEFTADAFVGSVWGHVGLGDWLDEHGHPEKAAACFKKALEIDPTQPHALGYFESVQGD